MSADIERSKRPEVHVSSAIVIENDRKELLFVRQVSEDGSELWGPPAGGMDSHEDPIMTAKREVREEIGVGVELIDIIGIYTVIQEDDEKGKTGLGFAFRGRVNINEITPGDEIADYGFFPATEVRKLLNTNKLYKPEYNIPAINDWFKDKSFSLKVVRSLIERG